MKVAPYLWQGEGAQLYMVGNPVVWWGSTLVLVSVLVQFVLLRPIGMRMPAPVNTAPRVWVALAAYAIAFLPLWPITRVLFLYHYQTPLLFAVAFVLLWLDRTGWVTTTSTGQPRNSYLAVITVAVFGYLLMSPLTYGFSVGGYDEALASVVRSWR
jgi:dolichyl-phosphate-mannose-protein mannosyltransferase